MVDNQWWCCAYFEVPYHGVSSKNAAGHLSLALRNRFKRPVLQPDILKFYEKGSFVTDANQSFMRGILGISDWQLAFMPCVNPESSEEPEDVRQTLLAALRRTEPGFERSWVAGLPGGIPWATVDYLLAVDKQERVYKFDPISQLWSSSLDGARSTPSVRIFRDSTVVPHIPVRLLLFTTNFEAYAFRLCPSGFTIGSGDVRSKEESKQAIRQFLGLLTARLHCVRTSSGIDLAEGYRTQLPVYERSPRHATTTNSRQPSAPAPSMNLFQIPRTRADDVVDTRPINNYPVHPINRLYHYWFQMPGEHDWIENTEFSFCRTYPLLVPSVRFQRSLMETRPFFEGFRFPVLSYYYKHQPEHHINHKADSDCAGDQCNPVRLLRAGQFHASIPLNRFLNSYVTKPPVASSDRSSGRPQRSKPMCIVRVRLQETDMETIRSSSDSFLPIHSNLSSLDTMTALWSADNNVGPVSDSTKSSSRSSWYVPLTLDMPPDGPNSNIFMPNHRQSLSISSPSQTVNHSIGSEFNWCAPNPKELHKAWLRLGTLVRLSQTHHPIRSGRSAAHTNSTDLSENTQNWSRRPSLGTVSMLDVHTEEHSAGHDSATTTPETAQGPMLWLDETEYPDRNMSASQSILYCLFRGGRDRTESQLDRPSLASLRLSLGNLSRLNYNNNNNQKLTGTDVLSSSDTQSLVPGLQKSRLPVRSGLSQLAAQRSPHRSDWQTHMLETKWLDLVLFGLKQANQLARLIVQLGANPPTPGAGVTATTKATDGTMLILTGPGSGRTWQPMLTSLVQLILCPDARTLAGFEDLIEREWVRYGYPFAPDPADWHDSAVTVDYEGGATFALFLDSVHQMLHQYPTEFAFTQDYLVALLDCALSRGGGLPPFAIEFACSCDAARCVSSREKSKAQVRDQSDALFHSAALRSFRDWPSVYTRDGCRLFANWCYWWHHRNNPLVQTTDRIVTGDGEFKSTAKPLFPLVSPASYLRFWIHGWFRWNRALRLCSGGGYAFDAAFYRQLMSIDSTDKDQAKAPFLRPTTSSSPYSGWLSDEAILFAESRAVQDAVFVNSTFAAELAKLAMAWELSQDLPGS